MKFPWCFDHDRKFRMPILISHVSIKFQADNNVLASPEAGQGNCLSYVLAPSSLSCEPEG